MTCRQCVAEAKACGGMQSCTRMWHETYWTCAVLHKNAHAFAASLHCCTVQRCAPGKHDMNNFEEASKRCQQTQKPASQLCSPEFVLCMNISLVLAQQKSDVSRAAAGSNVQRCAVVYIACEHVGTVGQQFGRAVFVTPAGRECTRKGRHVAVIQRR